jgi:hypothetical protein
MHRLIIAFSVVALMAGFTTEAEAQQSRAPEGFWVGGSYDHLSGWTGGLNGFRLEAGIPLGDLPIAIVLPFTFHGRNYGWGPRRLITIAPGIQYEYRLEQIEMPGLLSIYGEGHIGFFGAFERDNFFDDRYSAFGGVFRVNTGVRYYMEKPRGLYFHLTPIGFTAFMRNRGGVSYEFLTGVGYRFD